MQLRNHQCRELRIQLHAVQCQLLVRGKQHLADAKRVPGQLRGASWQRQRDCVPVRARSDGPMRFLLAVRDGHVQITRGQRRVHLVSERLLVRGRRDLGVAVLLVVQLPAWQRVRFERRLRDVPRRQVEQRPDHELQHLPRWALWRHAGTRRCRLLGKPRF